MRKEKLRPGRHAGRLKRFEVIHEDKVYVLFNIAWKAKKEVLDSYVEELLNEKEKHIKTLMFLDAYFELEKGQSLSRFEKLVTPLSQEQKRAIWRDKYRQRNAIELNLKLEEPSND